MLRDAATLVMPRLPRQRPCLLLLAVACLHAVPAAVRTHGPRVGARAPTQFIASSFWSEQDQERRALHRSASRRTPRSKLLFLNLAELAGSYWARIHVHCAIHSCLHPLKLLSLRGMDSGRGEAFSYLLRFGQALDNALQALAPSL